MRGRKDSLHGGARVYAAIGALAVLIGGLYIIDDDYILETRIDAPLDDVYSLLTNVSAITDLHPNLRGVHRVISETRGPTGAVFEWQLETSAMWDPVRAALPAHERHMN